MSILCHHRSDPLRRRSTAEGTQQEQKEKMYWKPGKFVKAIPCANTNKKQKNRRNRYAPIPEPSLDHSFGCWATEADNQPTRLVDGSEFFKQNVRTQKESATFEPWKSIKEEFEILIETDSIIEIQTENQSLILNHLQICNAFNNIAENRKSIPCKITNGGLFFCSWIIYWQPCLLQRGFEAL